MTSVSQSQSDAAGSQSKLTVTSVSSHSLGPLSVEVIPEEGDSLDGFSLSSAYPTHQISVPAGRYAVIARRPNGDRLYRSIEVTRGRPATVNLAQDIPPSPNEFMQEETIRGEVAPGRLIKKPDARLGVLRGAAGRAQQAVNVTRELVRPAVALPKKDTWTLRVWSRPGRDPEKARTQCSFNDGLSFLKVRTGPDCLAVGLLDERGFGPIVITPPFRQPPHITFLAEGVASRAAARSQNPSGQRAVVALATPQDPSVADLLSALGSPQVERTATIWEQISGSPDNARHFVYQKFENPVEALVGAHYLLRFLPDRLPLGWADNLGRALRDAADGPVIAAWLRLTSNAKEVRKLNPKRLREDVERLLTEALRRPVVYFARTRKLLVDGLRFLPDKKQPSARAKRGSDPRSFLDYGAHAGGLEAFWGSGPFHPGPVKADASFRSAEFGRVTLVGSTFVRAEIPVRQVGKIELRAKIKPAVGKKLAWRSGKLKRGAKRGLRKIVKRGSARA